MQPRQRQDIQSAGWQLGRIEACGCENYGRYRSSGITGRGGSVVYLRTHPVVAVKDSRPKPTKEELQDLRDKIDYAYLESLCSYLPEYDSAKDIPEKELNQIYEDAFVYCFEANYDEAVHIGDDSACGYVFIYQS